MSPLDDIELRHTAVVGPPPLSLASGHTRIKRIVATLTLASPAVRSQIDLTRLSPFSCSCAEFHPDSPLHE